MKRTTKQLAFTKTTVRVLQPEQLQAVNGGTIIYTGPILVTKYCVPTTLTAYQTGCDSTTSYNYSCTG